MVTEEYDNTLYEPGLIFKNEEEKSKIERGVAWLLRKLGSNIISGQSIMNISLPVFLFEQCMRSFAMNIREHPTTYQELLIVRIKLKE